MANLLQRRIVIVTILTLALCVPALAADSPAAPAKPAAAPQVERIVAVGDVHGDFDQFVKILRAAAVIDEKNNWIGGQTHLVQTGDVLDRGPDSRKAMDLLMALETQAAAAGGAVHALLGNHEAMVLLGDWRYVSPGEKSAFGGEEQYRQAMSAAGKYGQWIRKHDAVLKLNDLLFVHAGLRAAYADQSLQEINDAIRKQLADGAKDGLAADSDGPLWTRFVADGDEAAVAAELETVFKKYAVRRMVVGHTVDTSGITTRAGGRLIRIDVGMSKYYNGPAACLVVEKGVCYEVRDPGGKRPLDLPAAADKAKPAPAAPAKPEPAPATSR